MPDGPGIPQRGRASTGSSTTSDVSQSGAEGRLRTDSAASQIRRGRDRGHTTPSHVSDSDDSGLYSPDQEDGPSGSGRSQDGQRHLSRDSTADRLPAIELTQAEWVAQSLQRSLAPPPPDLISDLCDVVRDNIAAVIQKNQPLCRPHSRAEHGRALDRLIKDAVVAVRNLLYISAPPSGHIPSHLVPRDARDRRETTASQALLKPAQRKVTATLSKLVLSARAMEYDSGPAAQETVSRIDGDAEELERAILSFVVEVQRCHSERPPGGHGVKRVYGCFSTEYLGPGLVGAGWGGTWKGFGWAPIDDSEESPQRILDSDVLQEFKTNMASIHTKFGTLHSTLKNRGSDSRKSYFRARS